MTRLLFTNLAMLAGLAGLAIPILIHLLLRRKKQRLRFSTLRFFQRHDEHSSQRRKLRNVFLLAVRLLILTLLVLAFARPYLPGGNAGGNQRRQRLAVIVLDRSASMRAAENASPRWQLARDAVRKMLTELTPDDRAAIIGCSARSEVLSGAAPPDTIARLLKELQPAFGPGHLGDGLQLAKKLIANASPDIAATVYIVSDLQASDCLDLNACPVPQEMEIKTLKIGDVLTPNLGVTELQLDSRAGERPHLIIANYSDEEKKSVTVNLVLDGKEVQSGPVALGTGSVTRVELAVPALAPGWHQGAVRIEAGDALAIDDVRYDAFFIPQPVRVLVAETRRGKRPFEEESYFLTSALNPTQGTTNARPSRFQIEKVFPEELAGKLSAPPAAYDLVVLPGLKDIPTGLAAQLSEFTQAGGGLLLFLSDDVNATRYNNEFRALLPAQLGHVERNAAQAADDRWHLEDYDLDSPMFAVFRRPNSGNLALPEFTRRFTLVVDQIGMPAAKFADEVPVIVSKMAARGRVVLVNTSADTAWTDWPKHKTFVPWLHSICYHLAARAGADQLRTATHLVAVDDAEVSVGAFGKQHNLFLNGPGDKKTTVIADADGRLRNADFSVPGSYVLSDQAGHEVQRVAVNLPTEESDLAALTSVEFQRQLVRVPEQTRPTLAAEFFGIKSQHKEIWRILLLAVLGLLFAEVFVANRTFA
jgi:hypothetical protein